MDLLTGRKKSTSKSKKDKDKDKDKDKEGSYKRKTASKSIGIPSLNISNGRGGASTLESPATSPVGPSATSSTRYIQLNALLSPRSAVSLDDGNAVPSPRVRRLSFSRKSESCEIVNPPTAIGAEIHAMETKVDGIRERLRAPADQKDSVVLSQELVDALSELSALRATEAEELTRCMSGFMAVTKRKAVVRGLSSSAEGGSQLDFRARPSGHDSRFWFSLREKTLHFAESAEGPQLGFIKIAEDMAVVSIDEHRFSLDNGELAWEFYVATPEDHHEWTKAVAVAVGSGIIRSKRNSSGCALSVSPRNSMGSPTRAPPLKSPRPSSSGNGSKPSPRAVTKEPSLPSQKRRGSKLGKQEGVELQYSPLYRSSCDHAHYAALKAKLSPHLQVKIEEKLGLYQLLTGTLEDACAWVITFSVQQYMDNEDFAYLLLCRDFVCTGDRLATAFQKAWKTLNTRSASGSLPRRLHFVCRQWLDAPMVAKDVEEELAARKKFRRFCMRLMPDEDAYLAGVVIPTIDSRRDGTLPAPSFDMDCTPEKVAQVLKTAAPEDLAEQITLLNVEEFEKVPTRDFLMYVKNSAAPPPQSLQAIAKTFNKLTAWVAHTIVSKETERNRVTEFKRMLALAEKLHQLRNYHSASAVLGGLGHTAVSRMRKLQAAVPTKYTGRLLKLQQTYSPLSNYKNYRALPKHSPSIPIMAVFMKDLLSTSESNPTYCSDEEVSINFTKIQMVGSLLMEIQAPRSYSWLSKNFLAVACLRSLEPVSLDHSYSMSVKLEPVTSQQLEVEIQRLQSELAAANEENRQLREAAADHSALMVAAKRLPPPTCSCPHSTLLASCVRRESM